MYMKTRLKLIIEKYDEQGKNIWEPWEDWWVSEKYFDKCQHFKNINYNKTLGLL